MKQYGFARDRYVHLVDNDDIDLTPTEYRGKIASHLQFDLECVLGARFGRAHRRSSCFLDGRFIQKPYVKKKPPYSGSRTFLMSSIQQPDFALKERAVSTGERKKKGGETVLLSLRKPVHANLCLSWQALPPYSPLCRLGFAQAKITNFVFLPKLRKVRSSGSMLYEPSYAGFLTKSTQLPSRDFLALYRVLFLLICNL